MYQQIWEAELGLPCGDVGSDLTVPQGGERDDTHADHVRREGLERAGAELRPAVPGAEEAWRGGQSGGTFFHMKNVDVY